MVDVDYADGKVCLAGTITTNEWGAVYSLTFAPGDGENSWNALRAVSPASSSVSRGLTIEIPFTSTHPGCQATGSVPDVTKLTHIRLAMHPAQAAYDINFCVQLRAIP